MAITSVSISPDGQSVSAANVDFASITNATMLYACYSPSGAAGPFYASDNRLLTMGAYKVNSIAPTTVTGQCTYVKEASFSRNPHGVLVSLLGVNRLALLSEDVLFLSM
jgi:hypothetical protein